METAVSSLTKKSILDPKSKVVSTKVDLTLIARDLMPADNWWCEYSATGTAKCVEPDDFDPRIGERLALGRALKRLGASLTREAYNEVHAQDMRRESQERASQQALQAKSEATESFRLEYATLIEVLHPGTFKTQAPFLDDRIKVLYQDIEANMSVLKSLYRKNKERVVLISRASEAVAKLKMAREEVKVYMKLDFLTPQQSNDLIDFDRYLRDSFDWVAINIFKIDRSKPPE